MLAVRVGFVCCSLAASMSQGFMMLMMTIIHWRVIIVNTKTCNCYLILIYFNSAHVHTTYLGKIHFNIISTHIYITASNYIYKSATPFKCQFLIQDSLVGIATGYGCTALVRFPAWATDFSLFQASRQTLEPTQSPIQWLIRAFFSGVKLPGLEAEHSPLLSYEVKNSGAIPPFPHVFMMWCVIN
jgi:hypothetical protein